MTKHWTVPVTASLTTLLAIFAPTPLARADIFQWEYINPANPGLGKQQSTTLAPDGAGVNAVPGMNLVGNLTKAYLIGADLSGATGGLTNLTNAELSQANLTNVQLSSARLVNANLSQANLTNADFNWHSSGEADLTGANLSDANLTNANFRFATLTGTNLTGAEVRGAIFSRNTTDPTVLTGLTVAQLSSTASYQAHDLTGIDLGYHNLAGINLAGFNLTNAAFFAATLTGANLTGAEVRGANFMCLFTADQLYSTASYQARQLSGISLQYLPGVNLSGQDLTSASFRGDFAGANFSQANLTYSSLGDTLANADFSQANLTGAYIGGTMTGANLTGAEVRGAHFIHTGITSAQLYSTASYQAHDLTGIGLYNSDFTGWNFAGQNLTNAYIGYATLSNADLRQADLTNARLFNTDLTGANLSQANLTNAYVPETNLSNADLSRANLTNANFAGFVGYDDGYEYIVPGANLTNVNLSGADARGADFYLATLTGANTSNLIQSDGHIAGLNLTAGASLVVRDYDGNPSATPPTGPLPIVVDQHLAMNATGTLRLVFDADPWDSTISFAPGIPVALGGTLDLTFAPGVNVATQSGRTIDLFDWAGVTPTGSFTVSSPYTWNLSNLYTTGEVTLAVAPSLPGDFNLDGTVNAADYVVWRKTGGTQAGYNTWCANFGQPFGSGSFAGPNATVPEPAAPAMLLTGLVLSIFFRRRPEYHQA